MEVLKQAEEDLYRRAEQKLRDEGLNEQADALAADRLGVCVAFEHLH